MTDKPKYYVKKFGKVLANEVCCADPDLSSQTVDESVIDAITDMLVEEGDYDSRDFYLDR